MSKGVKPFIVDILKEDFGNKYLDFYNHSDIIQYLNAKTNAIYGDSKSRRNLASIYAIYVILQKYIDDFYNKPDDYRAFDGYEYTPLWLACKSLYGGEKIQNHALNNRVNSEFANKTKNSENKGKPLLIITGSLYLIHIDYIYVNGQDISKTIVKIIDKYIELLKRKDSFLMDKLEALSNEKDIYKIKNEIKSLLTDDSEARVFEIISYAILKNYYKETDVYIGYSPYKLKKEALTLYKTGRTNANDGGIDFVMRPLGRFFQVTEVGNYDKYFLDIDKVLHFPITFVIKTYKTKEEVISEFEQDIARKSGGMEVLVKKYMDSLEEVITLNELHNWYNTLDVNSVRDILNDIIVYYKMELNVVEDDIEEDEEE